MCTDQLQPTAWVYVVDDDREVRGSIELLVQTLGYCARTYRTAEAFLDGYEPGRNHCLVLDLHLPGMSGADLQRELITRELILPVIAMTAYEPSEVVKQSRQAGALAVLAKPFRLATLEPLIHQAVGVQTSTTSTC